MKITSTRFNQASGQLFEKSLGQNRVGRYLSKQFDKAVNEPAKFASSMLLTSIVSKDLVGCFVYTSQSLNNEKIPEEKRGYVAALDLINGILMVGGQLIVGKLIEAKLTPQLFGKFYSGTLKDKFTGEESDLPGKDAAKKARLAEDNVLGKVVHVIKEEGLKDVDAKKVADALTKNLGKGNSTKYKLIEAGFGLIVTALVTTALVKRTLVPMISTPVSAWFKDKFMAGKTEAPKNRVYYEWKNLGPKPTPKIDTTAFSNFQAK